MKLIISKLSGFCNGVNHTIEETNKILNQNDTGNIYCLGEIVHNENVIKKLESKGMITVSSLEEVPNHSTVIFRAHGETIHNYELAKNKKLEIIDLTCGRVKVIHKKIIKHQEDFIIIIGKQNHPEVKGHISYVKDGIIISNEEDIKKINKNKFKKNIYIVAQTTFNEKEFNNLTNLIKKSCNKQKITIDNTICSSTHNRQEEVKEISKQANIMLIIGSSTSSNTKELYNIAKVYCKNTYLISTKEDLDSITFDKKDIVGITSGASTSRDDIEEIINYLKEL